MLIGWQLVTSDSCRSICDSRQSVRGATPLPTRIILGLRPQSKANVFERHSSPDRNQTSDLGLRRQANIVSLAESSLAPPASTTTHFDYARCSYVNIARFAHGARVVSTKFAHQPMFDSLLHLSNDTPDFSQALTTGLFRVKMNDRMSIEFIYNVVDERTTLKKRKSLASL